MDFGVTPHDGLPLPPRVTIREVGPRDGLQNESAVLPVAVKAEFVERLVDAGPRSWRRRAWRTRSGYRSSPTPKSSSAITLAPGVRYPVLVPNSRGLERALDLGVRDIAVFAPVVARAREAGIGVRGYLSMCFGDPWEGEVPVPRVLDVATRMRALGCTELSLGDTIGVATPGRVAAVLDALIASGIPVDSLAVHFHDTYGQALANTLTAVRKGVTLVDASAGGLGGCPFAGSATGNLATEDLLWQLHGLGVDLPKMVDTSTWLAGHLGRPSPSRTVTALAG
ncbi:MAG: hydroxymethylglutaryl-CoA lyase [Actinomycetota bacterium]|nr:hydroxymethylglutaryl-CoA lyase [Actinomycetota bacterium]